MKMGLWMLLKKKKKELLKIELLLLYLKGNQNETKTSIFKMCLISHTGSFSWGVKNYHSVDMVALVNE